MPDAGASRKRQISGRGIPSDLRPRTESSKRILEVEARTSGPWNGYARVINAA